MSEAFILAWNEEETIHLTIKHYQNFCSSIVLMDNHSTDRTVEIAKSMGCKVKTFGVPGVLDDETYKNVKNECWKKSHPGKDRRNWVIVCDADEILWYPPEEPIGYACTIFKTYGWNVFSHEMPKENWLEITNGHHEPNYNKTVIFDPKQITDINFRIGAHVSSPKGNVIWSDDTLYLFHYRNVGGPQRLVDRHNLYRPRMSEANKAKRFGIHYLWEDEVRVKEWEEKYERSKHFVGVGISY